MTGSGDNMEVSITNPETKESRWVRVRDKSAKWYVESANPAARSVVVRLDGIALKLQMVSNTGESMSIAPQPTPLTADEAAAARNLPAGLDPKSVAEQITAMRAAGQQPTPEQMNAFRQQMDSLTPEQRGQFFEGLRTEMQARGGSFGPPGRTNDARMQIQGEGQTSSTGNVIQLNRSGTSDRAQGNTTQSGGGRNRGGRDTSQSK